MSITCETLLTKIVLFWIKFNQSASCVQSLHHHHHFLVISWIN